MNPPMNWVPVILVCWVLACFVFVIWFCVLFGFVLCVFAVCLVYDDDGPMDCVQVPSQFSFAALNSRWPGTLICNYCSCNVIQCGKRPGESHEGVGRKKTICFQPLTVKVASHGRNKEIVVWFFGSFISSVMLIHVVLDCLAILHLLAEERLQYTFIRGRASPIHFHQGFEQYQPILGPSSK